MGPILQLMRSINSYRSTWPFRSTPPRYVLIHLQMSVIALDPLLFGVARRQTSLHDMLYEGILFRML